MVTPEFKSKNEGGGLRSFFDFFFTLKNKKGELLDHWIGFCDDFHYSPEEFYETVEKELQQRKIPSMEISRETFGEGGLLSDKRVYLRLLRERLTVYACASPFGTGYFFSCRTVYVRPLVRLWHILAALIVFNSVGRLLIKPLGVPFAMIAEVALIFAVVAIMQNLSKSGPSDLDSLLLKIPAFSTIYETWFRADTYYRTDTRAIYLSRVPELVKELAQEIVASKGVKLVQQYRFAPIFGELYKPVPPKPDEK